MWELHEDLTDIHPSLARNAKDIHTPMISVNLEVAMAGRGSLRLSVGRSVNMGRNLRVAHANTAWCHLYGVCTDYWDDAGATILKRVESPFLLQMEAVTEEPELEDLNDLAVAIPLAIINVSNYSGLISSKNFSHMGMKHKFGDFSQDVALLQGSLANLFVNATCVSF